MELLILFQLHAQPLRFSELKRSIPEISKKMLIQELKSLEINKLVVRKNYGVVPPKVGYQQKENTLYRYLMHLQNLLPLMTKL
jgi:DNA-binding HxlR family transcriptional regulator